MYVYIVPRWLLKINAKHTHRIHGAGIYTNIGCILMGSMIPYIAAPWILWDMQLHSARSQQFPKTNSNKPQIQDAKKIKEIRPNTNCKHKCKSRIESNP